MRKIVLHSLGGKPEDEGGKAKTLEETIAIMKKEESNAEGVQVLFVSKGYVWSLAKMSKF